MGSVEPMSLLSGSSTSPPTPARRANSQGRWIATSSQSICRGHPARPSPSRNLCTWLADAAGRSGQVGGCQEKKNGSQRNHDAVPARRCPCVDGLGQQTGRVVNISHDQCSGIAVRPTSLSHRFQNQGWVGSGLPERLAAFATGVDAGDADVIQQPLVQLAQLPALSQCGRAIASTGQRLCRTSARWEQATNPQQKQVWFRICRKVCQTMKSS